MSLDDDGGFDFIELILDILMFCVGVYAASILLNFFFGDE